MLLKLDTFYSEGTLRLNTKPMRVV